MADELSDQLKVWVNSVKDAVDLSVDEQAEVTKAGAEVFAKELKKVTPVSDRAGVKHAKNSVLMQNTDINGNKNGESVVGYDSDHAFIMRFMNDGTKFYPKRKGKKFGSNHLNFYSKLFANQSLQNRVLEANASKLKEILARKQGGGD